MKIIDIWVNCPSPEIADAIAEHLLQRRLVACANRFGAIESRYRWQGAVQRATEFPLLLKTRAGLWAAVAQAAAALHPYQTPGITAVAVEDANAEYLRWVYAETLDESG